MLSLNSERYVQLLKQMFQQRREIFVDRLHYLTTEWSGPDRGESDAFDNGLTRYLLYVEDERVLSFVRFHPTHSRPYMIMREWSDHLKGAPPRSHRIVEGSRLAIRSDLEGAERGRALQALLRGMYSYCHQRGIDQILGAMITPVWERVFRSRGLPVDYLSDAFETDGQAAGEPTRIGVNPVSAGALKRLNGTVTIHDHVGRLRGPPALLLPAPRLM